MDTHHNEKKKEDKPADFIPTSFRSAISKIQKYYMVENAGVLLPNEYFDVEHVAAYSMVGMKSALHDTLLWALAYIVFGGIAYFIQYNYLDSTPLRPQTFEFFDRAFTIGPLYFMTKVVSFGYLATSTGWCVYASRYYVGSFGKKAINYLFLNRAIGLVVLSFATFLGLGVIWKYLLNDENLLIIGRSIYWLHPDTAERVYIFLATFFRRSLFESGIVAIVASVISIGLPFFSMLYFKVRKRRKQIAGPTG